MWRLGGEEGHARFCGALKALDMGQVLDIVPNHMATGPENKYWWDVLENGPSSRFAEWFDIDWNSAEVKLQNKVLIPVLGDQYGRVLSANQIAIEYDGESFQVRYVRSSLSFGAPLPGDSFVDGGKDRQRADSRLYCRQPGAAACAGIDR